MSVASSISNSTVAVIGGRFALGVTRRWRFEQIVKTLHLRGNIAEGALEKIGRTHGARRERHPRSAEHKPDIAMLSSAIFLFI